MAVIPSKRFCAARDLDAPIRAGARKARILWQIELPPADLSAMIEKMGFPVERADVADAAAILRLQVLAYQSEAEIYNNYNIPPLTQTLAAIEDEFRTHTFLVAQKNGEIIGSVRASCRDGRCLIGKLIVHPDHQRQGLGSQLVTAIEETFPEAKHFELFTGHRSERNLRLYNRLGYREFKRKQIAPGLIVVYLEKPNATPASNR